MVKELEATKRWQFELTLFLDKVNVPYSIFELGSSEIIVLPTENGSYYGLTLSPWIMAYKYREEDDEGEETFTTIQENELTLDELINWLSRIPVGEVKNLNKLISYLHKLCDQDIL